METVSWKLKFIKKNRPDTRALKDCEKVRGTISVLLTKNPQSFEDLVQSPEDCRPGIEDLQAFVRKKVCNLLGSVIIPQSKENLTDRHLLCLFP
jgi:hypothetical protein